MALILLDALPSGQVLLNTDKIIQARYIDGGVSIYLDDDNEIKVPHSDVHELLAEIQAAISTTKDRD